jgi:hypothetical protein
VQQNLLELDHVPVDRPEHHIEISAWIDHRGSACLLPDQQGTVLLKRRDRNHG